jgi:replicative DNA helicase
MDDAEGALLGACLVQPDCIERVADVVQPADFRLDVYAEIFGAMLSLIASKRAVSPLTIAPMVDLHPYFVTEQIDPKRFLVSLATSTVTTINAPHYAETIADAARRREVIAVVEDYSKRLAHTGELRAVEIIDQLDAALLDVARRAPSIGKTSFGIGEAAMAVVEASERAFASGGVSLPGLTTCLPSLDNIIEGFDAGDLVLIGARPSMGKTALALTLALSWAQRGLVVPFFSLEMSAEQLALRALASRSNLPGMAIRAGRIRPEDFATLMDRVHQMKDMNLIIEQQPTATMATLRARMAALSARHGRPGAIVVDYLQLVSPSDLSRRQGRNAEITEISAGLKALAREYACPVFALSQLNRQLEQRHDGRPQLSDLRDSGSLEQDADVVMFVYRHEQWLEAHKPPLDSKQVELDDHADALTECRGHAELIISKHRQGRLGTAKVRFNKETTLFFDKPRSAYEEQQG